MPRAVIIACFNYLQPHLREKWVKVLVCLLNVMLSVSCLCQEVSEIKDDEKVNRRVSLGVAGGLTVGSYVILNSVWYSEFNRDKFHFFNDISEWNGMDKAGHMATSYNLSTYASSYYRRFGWEDRSPLLGAVSGFIYASSLEVLDAYSKDWGFSVPDIVANFSGSGMYYLQEKLWQDQKVRVKWSYSASGMAGENPSLLGASSSERVFKDYNGQTYWLSAGVMSFSKTDNKRKWLAVAVGYGISDFTRARPSQVIGDWKPRSEYYLSLDIDWSRIPVRNKHLKNVLSILNFIKVPFPALQWDKSAGFTVNPLHF